MRAASALLAVAAALLPAAAAAAGPVRAEDLYRVRSVREVRLSPDGRRLAYVSEHRDRPGAPYTQLWLVDADGRRSTRVGAVSAASPRWSPDGRLLACLMTDGRDRGVMVFRSDGSGGVRLAAVADTNHPVPSAADRLAWSPDSRRIAFVSATPGPEPDPRGADPVVVTRYLYKPGGSEGASRWNDNRRLHVFVADVIARSVRQLTRGDGYEHSISWSPDGGEIAYVASASADERVFNNDVFAVRVSDGVTRRLTDTPSAEYAPAWSPDGRSLAFLATKRLLTSSETTMEDTHVWVMAADGSGRREIGASVDNRQGDPQWWPDGQSVLTAVHERGAMRLYRLPVDGGEAAAVVPETQDRGWIRSWSVARDGSLALAMATPAAPAEAYVRPPSAPSRRLTAQNDGWLPSRTVAPFESFTFPAEAGLEVEAFLTRPHGRTPTSRHPLVVAVHGGPHHQQGPQFDWKAQAYAGEGWATLMVNYRGSTGYGQKLTDAIFRDQNGAEARDILAGVDAALARFPWLDPERLAIEGTSYGGQLANWIVTKTDRFRAAVPLAGISNLVSFNYTAYYHDYLAVEFGAFPHEGDLMDLLWQRSPLRHVARVRTPVLLLHGENDSDVPVSEAEQFYVALKDVGAETALVRYPREGHGLRETAHQVDALERSIAWYKRHFAARR